MSYEPPKRYTPFEIEAIAEVLDNITHTDGLIPYCGKEIEGRLNDIFDFLEEVIAPALHDFAEKVAKEKEKEETEKEEKEKRTNPCNTCLSRKFICGKDEDGKPTTFCPLFIEYANRLTEEDVDEIEKSDPCGIECPEFTECDLDHAIKCRQEISRAKVLLYFHRLDVGGDK